MVAVAGEQIWLVVEEEELVWEVQELVGEEGAKLEEEVMVDSEGGGGMVETGGGSRLALGFSQSTTMLVFLLKTF